MVWFAFKQQTITYKKYLSQYTNQETLNCIRSTFKETVRYLVWTCRDPIFLFLGNRFSFILAARW